MLVSLFLKVIKSERYYKRDLIKLSYIFWLPVRECGFYDNTDQCSYLCSPSVGYVIYIVYHILHSTASHTTFISASCSTCNRYFIVGIGKNLRDVSNIKPRWGNRWTVKVLLLFCNSGSFSDWLCFPNNKNPIKTIPTPTKKANKAPYRRFMI